MAAVNDLSPLSVVVCTYERYHRLPCAIESLLTQDIELEVIVVDNSRDQAAAARFARRYDGEPRVRYTLAPRRGLSLARNVGVGLARGPTVAFIDDDALAAPHWASNILAAFDYFGPLTRVVGGRVVPRWVSERPSWLDESLLGYLSVTHLGESARELMDGEWLAGCNIAFDKASLEAVGCFPEWLGRIGSDLMLLSNEEGEVVEKIQAVGAKVIYAPQAIVEHVIDPARLTPSWFRRRAAWQAVSNYIKDPEATAQYSRTAIEHLMIMQKAEPRKGLGFFGPPDNAAKFARELRMMYDMVLASLSGGVQIGDEDRETSARAPEPRRSMRD